MKVNVFWRRSFLFCNKFEITTPVSYAKRTENDDRCLFLGNECKGIVINKLDKPESSPRGLLASIYSKCKGTNKNISQPIYKKRYRYNSEQYMLRFTYDNRNAIISCVSTKENMYVVEFTYTGYIVNGWIKECEQIINTIRIKQGENEYGD